MTTTLGFKDVITLPQWRSLAPLPYGYGWAAGVPLIGDLRNNVDCHPLQYWLLYNTVLYAYHVKNDGWGYVGNPSMSSNSYTATTGAFCPSQGPSGTLAAGASTTSVILNTALPAAVGVNQLANRGDGQGFKIRIIGLSAGGSGKTEEKLIVGNSGGTQPTIYLDSALSFTPAATDRYEILAGRVYFLTAASAGAWKYYDVATNSYSGNLSVVNLPSINTDSSMISLDELHVPSTRVPGDGYFGNLIATGSAAGTLTGQAALGDVAVLQNEYCNFQIRIVQDTAIPTAVGQRRRIASHTAGASPIYTLASNWTVTPSVNATYVIENDTDKIILWTGGQAATYCYNVVANTWDTTTFASRVSAMAAGCMSVHTFGITLDTGKNARYSHILSFRGGAATLDLFDIAGAATGAWTLNISYTGAFKNVPTTGFAIAYAPATEAGRYAYINYGANSPQDCQMVFRFDVRNRCLEPWAFLPFNPGNAPPALTGMRLATTVFVDGSTKLSFLNMISGQSNNTAYPYFWQCAITR